MPAACTSNHQPVVKPDARSSVGYDRSLFLSPLPYPTLLSILSTPAVFSYHILLISTKSWSDGDGFCFSFTCLYHTVVMPV